MHATAEWIEETPLLIGTGAGLADLPNLSNVPFSNARTNGAAFTACAWATSC